MADFFSGKARDKNEAVQLCEVFLLYFDEEYGHMPLLISPDERIMEDPKIMRLIRIHSIWFLDISDDAAPDRMDLEYGGKMYFAKKFIVPSNRIKRRAGLEHQNFETVVLILALPIDMDIFGGDLLKKSAERITKHFKDKISQLIECEIAKTEVIKTPEVKETIQNGEKIKKRMKALIKNNCSQYFDSVLKQTDATTLKIQKTISFLTLKGISVSYIRSENKELGFSNINLFEAQKNQDSIIMFRDCFKIEKTFYNSDSEEIEVVVQNLTKKEIKEIIVKVSSIKDFFELEILSEKVDVWLPEEELLFIIPHISLEHEYIIKILKEPQRTIIFHKKIYIQF